MEPCDASTLTPETPVWIWILRQGNGQWCPGTVRWVAARDGATNVSVRFECHSLQRGKRVLSESVPHKPDIWTVGTSSAGEAMGPSTFLPHCPWGQNRRFVGR